MIRFFILVSSIFVMAFSSFLAPFFLENGTYEELVPIPLPWKNESYKRSLDVKIAVETNDSMGVILRLNGCEPSDFKIILSLRTRNFLLSLTVGNDISCEIQASDYSKKAEFFIDFDKDIIKLNDKQSDCINISTVQRKEDSLEIKIGGIQNGCVKINQIKISNESVKLESSRLNYAKCSFFEEYHLLSSEVEKKSFDPGAEVENRGHSHHHKI